MADHRRAGVDPDPHAQRRAELFRELDAHLGKPPDHRPRRLERIAATLRRAGLHAEQRHHAVAGELVGDAAGLLDRAAHDLEIAVQEEHDVVGQLVLGEAGEAAQIREQHADVAFLPGNVPGQ